MVALMATNSPALLLQDGEAASLIAAQIVIAHGLMVAMAMGEARML